MGNQIQKCSSKSEIIDNKKFKQLKWSPPTPPKKKPKSINNIISLQTYDSNDKNLRKN